MERLKARRNEDRPRSGEFESFALDCLQAGLRVRFQARGASMSPAIRDGETVYVKPASEGQLRKGDIVLVKGDYGFRLHRLIKIDAQRDIFITRGDCGVEDDPPVLRDQILGVAVAKDVRVGAGVMRAQFRTLSGRLLRIAARTQHVVTKASSRAGLRWLRKGRRPVRVPQTIAGVIGILLLLAVPHVFAQSVAVDSDPSTSGSADLVGSGTQTLSFTHSTSTTANRALLVGVSMNITNAPTTGVVGITYNGTALNFVGAQNDASNTRRVELWYLLAPASGTNLPIIVSVNIPAAATVGVVAGATVFTDVDQTVPLGTFASADGEFAACVASSAVTTTQCNSQINIVSVVNGMVFDTVAVGLGQISANGPQVSQWNVASGGTTSNATQDVTGATSTRGGAPAVPDADSFNEVLTLTAATAGATGFNATSVVQNYTNFALTKVGNAGIFSGQTTYTGTITGGNGNAYNGDTFIITGFTNANNDGTFTAAGSSNTTLVLNNPNGVAQTQAANAALLTSTTYNGIFTGGAGNAYNGKTVVISGFTNAANNGTFTISASTATSITVNNKASVAETNPGTAVITTGTSTMYTGTITGGVNNGFAGDSFTIAGFTNANDNGTFTCTASTATTLTCSDTAGVTQTHAGTATTNATFNWSEGAVSVNPSTADLGVTTSVASAVFTGQNTTFTTTVSNNGPSAAVSPSLTLTWPTSLTVVSITPSSGTTCTAAPPPITCTPPTPFTSSMTATVAVTVNTSTAGAYAETATVTDSGTPPDPNTGNNTYTAVATVQALACATVTQAAPGTSLTGTLNTYYPGSASVAAGAVSIPVGTPTGATATIAKGTLLLVIQMQDASINDSNSVAYGNGYTGQGFTNLNSAGDYEFVTATGPIAAGAIPISGAGAGNGLVFAYHESAETATAGQSTYQVIVVPQYTTASFSTTSPPTALAWNGSTGGVFVIDTSSTLSLNGATIAVDGLGFRGGAGMELQGGGGATTDYRQPAVATYAGVAEAGWDAPKGEGIAGTPAWVQTSTSYLATGTGYPSGTAGTDGSFARGAPGNAGGGGTDGDPQTASPNGNDENAGGGGGGNGGAGGFGGNSWSNNLSVGGEGGAVFPATINRVVMGGGGGGGSRNNDDGNNLASGGSAGGGIIIIRTWGLSGSSNLTLTANGSNAYNGTANDAGGGGGAAGSIVVLSANGGEAGLTLNANGGTGGNAWETEAFTWGNRHGPGGGGGGGVILVSGNSATTSVSGGADGLTETPGVPYGSTSGASGVVVMNETIAQTSGTQSGAQCTPDMTLAKNSSGSFTRGQTATYTIPVSNISPYGPSSGTVTVNDTLPVGVTPTGASGSGWTCTVAGQTVSCIDTTPLPGNTTYPSITVTANVLQTAPSTVTNIATVSGGGELNLTNDTATNIATVGSSADLSVTNVASPDPVAAGGNITYTQTVTDNGPSAADNATLTEAIPANTTLVSVTAPAGWNCISQGAGSTGNVVCTALTMAASTQATISMIVKVNSGVATGTVITDTATASSSVSDPNIANNTASASTVVGTGAGGKLAVTNMVSPGPVAPGGTITYTQVVTNSGTAAVTSATFSEPTPTTSPATTLTFGSVTAAPGWTCSGPPVSCTDPSVPSGYAGTFTVTYTVSGTATSGTTISDTATVTPAGSCGPCSATATDTVAPATQATLALSTVATPATVFPGNNITYTQTITNNGPAAATTPTFTEAIPASTTYVSVSAPAGWTCTVTTSVVCNDTSNMAASTSADIIVSVNVASTVTATSTTATSSVSASNSATSTTNVTTQIAAACDLSVTNTGSPSPITANNPITYTQVVTNNGPSNCAGATFTEAFPANTSFTSMGTVPSGWSCTTTGSISCSDPSVAPNTPVTFAPVFTVLSGTAAGTIITDTANVATTTRDTNTANNSATSTIGVTVSGDADLSLTNAGSPNPVNAGQNVTFTQTVTNAGPASASTVTLAETLPAGTTFVSLNAPPTSGWSCTTVSPYQCTDSSVATGSTTFTFVVQVPNTATSGTAIADSAKVTSSVTTDPNPNNNTAASTVYVADSADLSVTNSPSPVPVQATNNITYTQTVVNNGPSTATGVTFTETTPPNTNFQSLTAPGTWSCSHPTTGSAGTITCTIASLAPGTANFSVQLQVNSGTTAGTAINNTDTVTSSTTDPNSANNSATASDVVATSSQADLVMTNVASPTTVSPGGTVTYTQTFSNLGPATATSPTFTEVIPPNMTFQSIATPGASWTCTTTGTISCTDSSSLATATPQTFTVMLQVVSTTPSGTNLADTATASASNIVPSLTTNSATATVVVANANSADMSIIKTASPSPTVAEGDILTYTLAVTNGGPATATDVTVTDTLPANVNYLSYTSTQGTCSEADGTVTCLLGTMTTTPGTATVTIVTLAGAPGSAVNTATVSADQSDPNPNNNTSTQTEIITAVTNVKLQSFGARIVSDKTGASRVALLWKTGGESHNLGFNVYRETNGQKVRLNSSLIAGSALMMSGALPKHSGKTYSWIDSVSTSLTGSYWLEDVDVNGTRTMHGPVTSDGPAPANSDLASSVMLNELQQSQPAASADQGSHAVESSLPEFQPSAAQQQKQFAIAAQRAVKIFVKHEGWHHVTQLELLQAGLDPNVDPAMLHLYAEAVEQPVQITGAEPGPGGFGAQAAIQFYGTGIDTPYSGTRVYWLVAENQPGQRIAVMPPSSGSNQPPANFPFTVELTPHTTYYSSLITSDGNNFFGSIVSTTPLDQSIYVPHLDKNAATPAKIEIILQGVLLGVPHEVSIAVNGATVGETSFTGEAKGTFGGTLPPGVLRSGANTVTLTAEDGDYDYSLVQSIQITYPHLYVADADSLKFTGNAGDEVKITGFDSAPAAVLDITNPDAPVQLTPQITADSVAGKYAMQVQVPWSSGASASLHTLLAVASDRVDSPAGMRANHPSHWHSPQQGSDIAMVTYGDFASSLTPLIAAHAAQGKSSSVIFVDDLYDEFNFGEHSPYAIRNFLSTAMTAWHTPPHYLLLNGRASFDPRNFLGFGHLDLVPTMFVPTSNLMTASDDWFSDFSNTATPTIATGRFPVTTVDDASLVAGKVAGYEGPSANGPWSSDALFVADVNDTENFTQDSQLVEKALPKSMNVTDVFATGMSIPTAQQEIVDSINAGQLLVNYSGHGSEELWSGDDLFNNTAANALTNGTSLPVFLIMNCLNGFFQDVYEQPLAVTLMLAPNGGAVAVLASSGLNQPTPQTNLDKLVVQDALHAPYPAIGDAILNAKSQIKDVGVRQTFNLLGDPAMPMKRPAGNGTH